jgi:ubiquinone/menaquinone biosynthesis C-methylase UbiE
LVIRCGRGEALQLVGAGRARNGIDISRNMLEAALTDYAAHPNIAFVQGDATRLPLADDIFDEVSSLASIVNDRHACFRKSSVS